MQHTPLKDLICASLFIVSVLYGSCGLFAELVNSILPFGFILTLLAISAGYFLRVPAPCKASVEAVIGVDPCLAGNNQGLYVMKTVAHRGAGLDAPENSLAAFDLCAQKGCDCIEFDVTLTKDDVPVVFHDSTLERMTDSKMSISGQNFSDLLSVDISVKHIFKDRFAQTNIPTLDQTVAQLLAAGQRMIIDIKDNNKKFVKIIHNLFERYPDLYSKAMVSSFFPNIIYSIRKGNPNIVCSLAWRPHVFAYESYSYPVGKGTRRANTWYKHYFFELCDILHEWALHRFTYYILGLSVILLHKDVINGRAILSWRDKGLRVMAWTVNTPAEKQYLARVLKITYLTDTLTGEGTTHSPPI